MTSQPGFQTVAIYILPNISQSEGNQTEAGKLVADLFLFLEKT